MALKVLPEDVRSMLCATAQINNYKTAVAELVYNSLDAESTSIAIRIDMEENKVQVIDNGNGIMRKDFDVLGQRYMTSKLTDLSTLKSMPKCYGYRGEFLANIIEISKNVKIISRHKDGEETWSKTFCNGKKTQFAKMTTRPSKGTTIEIKGFLYNLNIQKRAIDPVNELQNIKLFLEQLSIAHNGVSLSLRDDTKNEIIFKIHKKSNVYQTLSILFDIDTRDVQELQVEKNQYKVKAFIGKTDNDIGRHWVYLNGRFVQGNTKLHKIINENFKKYLLIKYKRISKSKKDHDEEDLFKQNLPFYFIFVTCPYTDYHINFTSRQSLVEFKHWEQIKIMLEKLVKLYIGDINLKKNDKIEKKVPLKKSKDTGCKIAEDKIQKIINNILGSSSKRLGVSQLQNGVKGKLVNRKSRKKKDVNAQSNILQNNQTKSDHHKNNKLRNKSPHLHIIEDRQECISKATESKHMYNRDESIVVSDDLNKQDFNNDNRCDENVKKPVSIINSPGLNINKDIPKLSNKIHKITFNKNKKVIKSKNCKKKNEKKANKMHKLNVMKSHNLQIKELNASPPKHQLVPQRFHEHKKHPNKDYVAQMKDANSRNALNMLAEKQYHNNLNNCNRPKKLNDYRIGYYVPHYIKRNPFKTTYDLVQTILESQHARRFYQTPYSIDDQLIDYPIFNRGLQTISSNTYHNTIKPKLAENDIVSTKIESSQTKCDEMFENRICSGCPDNISQYTNAYYRYNNTSDHMVMTTQQSLRCEDIFKENSDIQIYTQCGASCDSNNPTTSRLTYESHKYNEYVYRYTSNINTSPIISKCVKKARGTRFITKQSRDNFTSNNKYKSLYKSHFKNRHYKQRNKRTDYYSEHIKQTADKSYTIEFTKSSEINCSIQYSEILVSNQSDFSLCYNHDENKSLYRTHTSTYEPIAGFGNTYTLPNCNVLLNYNISNVDYQKNPTNHDEEINSAHNSSADNNHFNLVNTIATSKDNCYQDVDKDIITLVTKSQSCGNDRLMNDDLEPLEVCETVLSSNETIERECPSHVNDVSRLDKTLYNNFDDNNKNDTNLKEFNTQLNRRINNEDVSHHFSNTLNSKDLNIIDRIEANLLKNALNTNSNENNNLAQNEDSYLEAENMSFNIYHTDFNFKDRLRFLPKGMSQIFEKCKSKTVCDYNLDGDYYEDIIYNDFANDVQKHADVYEPVIQNAEDFTTKDINIFENKVHKDNTSLIFDQNSLKGAKVLNQIDCKFISAIMKEKCREVGASEEYLVLFDQHAVHERIRLEQNLASYFLENAWRSVAVDNIIIKISKDEIVYLHNYKDKFNQLGLEWTILDKDEVSLISIPEAIFGKNPREVDKVIKAVKNLIKEQIGVIKLQKGCISLYPKSIMDLVFSEACRYAIKFGDKLTKNYCVELLNDLSNCKTPFQCAHGRPVMAVLVDLKQETREYKVNIASLRRFKLEKTRNV